MQVGRLNPSKITRSSYVVLQPVGFGRVIGIFTSREGNVLARVRLRLAQ